MGRPGAQQYGFLLTRTTSFNLFPYFSYFCFSHGSNFTPSTSFYFSYIFSYSNYSYKPFCSFFTLFFSNTSYFTYLSSSSSYYFFSSSSSSYFYYLSASSSSSSYYYFSLLHLQHGQLPSKCAARCFVSLFALSNHSQICTVCE